MVAKEYLTPMVAKEAPREGKLDIAQRASYISGTAQDKDGDYMDVKTPADDIEGGVLRSGSAPSCSAARTSACCCTTVM